MIVFVLCVMDLPPVHSYWEEMYHILRADYVVVATHDAASTG